MLWDIESHPWSDTHAARATTGSRGKTLRRNQEEKGIAGATSELRFASVLQPSLGPVHVSLQRVVEIILAVDAVVRGSLLLPLGGDLDASGLVPCSSRAGGGGLSGAELEAIQFLIWVYIAVGGAWPGSGRVPHLALFNNECVLNRRVLQRCLEGFGTHCETVPELWHRHLAPRIHSSLPLLLPTLLVLTSAQPPPEFFIVHNSGVNCGGSGDEFSLSETLSVVRASGRVHPSAAAAFALISEEWSCRLPGSVVNAAPRPCAEGRAYLMGCSESDATSGATGHEDRASFVDRALCGRHDQQQQEMKREGKQRRQGSRADAPAATPRSDSQRRPPFPVVVSANRAARETPPTHKPEPDLELGTNNPFRSRSYQENFVRDQAATSSPPERPASRRNRPLSCCTLDPDGAVSADTQHNASSSLSTERTPTRMSPPSVVRPGGVVSENTSSAQGKTSAIHPLLLRAPCQATPSVNFGSDPAMSVVSSSARATVGETQRATPGEEARGFPRPMCAAVRGRRRSLPSPRGRPSPSRSTSPRASRASRSPQRTRTIHGLTRPDVSHQEESVGIPAAGIKSAAGPNTPPTPLLTPPVSTEGGVSPDSTPPSFWGDESYDDGRRARPLAEDPAAVRKAVFNNPPEAADGGVADGACVSTSAGTGREPRRHRVTWSPEVLIREDVADSIKGYFKRCGRAEEAQHLISDSRAATVRWAKRRAENAEKASNRLRARRGAFMEGCVRFAMSLPTGFRVVWADEVDTLGGVDPASRIEGTTGSVGREGAPVRDLGGWIRRIGVGVEGRRRADAEMTSIALFQRRMSRQEDR